MVIIVAVDVNLLILPAPVFLAFFSAFPETVNAAATRGTAMARRRRRDEGGPPVSWTTGSIFRAPWSDTNYRTPLGVNSISPEPPQHPSRPLTPSFTPTLYSRSSLSLSLWFVDPLTSSHPSVSRVSRPSPTRCSSLALDPPSDPYPSSRLPPPPTQASSILSLESPFLSPFCALSSLPLSRPRASPR